MLPVNLNTFLCSQNAFFLPPPTCKGTRIKRSLKSRRQKAKQKPAFMVRQDLGSEQGTNMDRHGLLHSQTGGQRNTLSCLDTEAWDKVGKESKLIDYNN